MAFARSRFVLALVLLSTWLIGGTVVSGPLQGTANAGDLTAASKVLSQTGTVGKWTVQEPPGFPAVPCIYPSGADQIRTMGAANVLVYPRSGVYSEIVQVTTAIKRRLPDGSLQSITNQPNTLTFTGTATLAEPFQSIPYGSGGYNLFGDLGSTYVQTTRIQWGLSGSVELLLTSFQTTLQGSPNQILAVTDACYPALQATGSLSDTSVTVDQQVDFNYVRMPSDPSLGVGIYIDGVYKGSWSTNEIGNGSYRFMVKPAPMGKHTIKAYRYGRSATATFTIVPRIKVRPQGTHQRGAVVDISLRGFAKYETVAIRWKKGSSWVQIASVKTSGTGSANIDVKVPTWVPDGPTSVRGDGAYGHAQTNAVTVSGGAPLTSSAAKVATPAAAKTTSATATPIPATATPQPAITAVPTEQPGSESTPTATPTIVPTEEVPPPVETPSAEPVTTPMNETPEPTAPEGEA